MTPFACENGNLFGCVSKTSCCEYLVKDTRSEKMTQLSQAPLTALFLVVSLSILYRKHFCVFVFLAFLCGLGEKNEERESQTARKVPEVKEGGGGLGLRTAFSNGEVLFLGWG